MYYLYKFSSYTHTFNSRYYEVTQHLVYQSILYGKILKTVSNNNFARYIIFSLTQILHKHFNIDQTSTRTALLISNSIRNHALR